MRGADASARRARAGLLAGLFLASGVAGLLYQILWQRSLTRLFGAGTQAAAATLVVFFLGLAIGAGWWGRRAGSDPRPLRLFGWLEMATGLLALLAFAILPLWESLFPAVWRALGDHPALLSLAKVLLAVPVLLPAAAMMGGTLPALVAAAEREGLAGDKAAIALYGINTAGAVLGALSGAFLFTRLLGVTGAYLLAVGMGLGIGVVAWLADRSSRPPASAATPAAHEDGSAALPFRTAALAFAAGALALAVEVLATKALALRLQSSLYTYALVVSAFLVALVLGASLARLLLRRVRLESALVWLLVTSGAALVVMPWWMEISHDIGRVAGPFFARGSFTSYAIGAFTTALLALVPFALPMGTVLPLLMGGTATSSRPRLVGSLAAINTIGAVCGSLVAGFLLLRVAGPFTWLTVFGAVTLVISLAVARRRPRTSEHRVKSLLVQGGLVLLLVGAAMACRYQLVHEAERLVSRQGEVVRQVYTGPFGVVAVTERSGVRRLRFNRGYILGASSDPRWERLQAHLPLCLHPEPKRAFFLGLGTGVTAGAATVHDLEHIEVAELVPEVIEAARTWFGDVGLGLYSDPRARIFAEDGRVVLRARAVRHDVIVGDLFLPWKQGVGSLFTREHFEAVRDRLTPAGLFAQWLPLYQLSEEEFLVIARAFREAFPRACVIRADYFVKRPIVALVGLGPEFHLDFEGYRERFLDLSRRDLLGFRGPLAAIPAQSYVGNLEGLAGRLREVPENDDQQPWIELEAPLYERARAAGTVPALTGEAWLDLCREMVEGMPRDRDPLLEDTSEATRRLVDGGLALYGFTVYRQTGQREQRRAAFARFMRLVPMEQRPDNQVWLR